MKNKIKVLGKFSKWFLSLIVVALSLTMISCDDPTGPTTKTPTPQPAGHGQPGHMCAPGCAGYVAPAPGHGQPDHICAPGCAGYVAPKTNAQLENEFRAFLISCGNGTCGMNHPTWDGLEGNSRHISNTLNTYTDKKVEATGKIWRSDQKVTAIDVEGVSITDRGNQWPQQRVSSTDSGSIEYSNLEILSVR